MPVLPPARGETVADLRAAADSIESFCRRLSPLLVGSLTLQCENRLVAEEIAQEALARAWERWDVVSLMSSPDGWTYRVAFNLAKSHYRRRQAEKRAMDRLESGDPGPSDLDP